MPQRQPVRGDTQTVLFIETVMKRAAIDQSRGFVYLYRETLDEASMFYMEFAPQVRKVADLVKKRRKLVKQVERDELLLKVRLRAVWDEIKARVKTGMDSTALYAHYKLSDTGESPESTTREGWLSIAAQVVEGMHEAQMAGVPPVEAHSALMDALHQAQVSTATLSDMKEEVNTERTVRDAMRPRGRKVCRHVMRDLRYLLGEETYSRQREIMRAYGVRFKNTPGENTEGDAKGDVAGDADPSADDTANDTANDTEDPSADDRAGSEANM